MKHILGILIFLLGISAPVIGANYLLLSDMGISAETIGRGNVTGFDHSASGLFENPATLYLIPDISLSFFKTTLIGELAINTVSLSKTFKNQSIGFGYLNGSVGDLYGTSYASGVIIADRTFDYSDSILKLSYARRFIKNYYMGTNFSTYTKRIDTYTAKGYGFDLGTYYQGKSLETSLVIHNILKTKATYSNATTETIPTQLILSAKYPVSRFDLYGQLNAYQNVGILFAGGIESEVPKIPYLKVSVGYKQFNVLNQKRSNFTLGMALKIFGLSVNYAFEKSDHVEFNFKHYASISINYDRIWKKRGHLTIHEEGGNP